MKTVIFGLALAFSSVSFGATLSSHVTSNDIDQSYNKLDIQKIISKTDISGLCGVRPIEFVYLDHHNHQQVYKYLSNDECWD